MILLSYFFDSRSMNIVSATFEHLEILAELFDAYRVFYQQPSDVEGARAFLRDRLPQTESVVFLATPEQNGTISGMGFTQLYPSFSSVSMRRLWILNDLYVDADARKRGVAKALMNHAKLYALSTNAVRIELATWVANLPAQRLYESLNYERADTAANADDAFYHYSLSLA